MNYQSIDEWQTEIKDDSFLNATLDDNCLYNQINVQKETELEMLKSVIATEKIKCASKMCKVKNALNYIKKIQHVLDNIEKTIEDFESTEGESKMLTDFTQNISEQLKTL